MVRGFLVFIYTPNFYAKEDLFCVILFFGRKFSNSFIFIFKCVELVCSFSCFRFEQFLLNRFNLMPWCNVFECRNYLEKNIIFF